MDRIVIELPPECKNLKRPIEQIVGRVSREIAQTKGRRARKYAEVEAGLAEDVAALERAGHGIVLAALDVDEPRIVVAGKAYARIGQAEAPYYTQAGEVRVMRTLYRPLGEHNGRTVDPVSLRAGVVGDGWLPKTATAMAHELARGPSREAVSSCAQMGRLPYSRCSFERVGHLVATQVRARQDDIEDQLIESFEIPEGAVAVSASMDRVTVPMEEPRPRPVGRPRRRAARRPVMRVHRMAYVGTVTLHDADGRALHTIRYGGMPDLDAASLAQALARDVRQLLLDEPSLHVVLLADGAKELWGVLEQELSPDELGIEPKQMTMLIDFWHVIEKVSAAATAIWGEEAGRARVAEWRRLLTFRREAPKMIRRQLLLSGAANKRVDGHTPVREAITYLENNGHRMRYVKARRDGLPIGSGNVEATCKSLVSMRMKRPGARWKTETGENVLQLRALLLSDRWDAGVGLALQPLRVAVHPFRRAA